MAKDTAIDPVDHLKECQYFLSQIRDELYYKDVTKEPEKMHSLIGAVQFNVGEAIRKLEGRDDQ